MKQWNFCNRGNHRRLDIKTKVLRDEWDYCIVLISFRKCSVITICNLPILTGNPGGKLRVTKSRSRAKWELVRAMRSIIGVTCSTRDRGCSSLIHNVPLNLHQTRLMNSWHGWHRCFLHSESSEIPTVNTCLWHSAAFSFDRKKVNSFNTVCLTSVCECSVQWVGRCPYSQGQTQDQSIPLEWWQWDW